MAITLRCILLFIAFCSLVELIVFCAFLNGYLQQLEPLLYLVFDEEQMEVIRSFKEFHTQTGSSTTDDIDALFEKIDEINNNRQGGESLGFTRPSSPSSATEDNDPIHEEARRAVNEKFASVVMSLDVDEARTMLKFSSGVDVNYVAQNGGHLLFRLCSGKKETPQMLKMVDLLLAQKDIDPNDDSTSWPPLKAAIHARNIQCAVKLLRHKDTVPMVHAAGLTCDSVPHILSEITIVVSKETPDCFLKHTNIAQMEDEKVLEWRQAKLRRRGEIRLARGLNDQLKRLDKIYKKSSAEKSQQDGTHSGIKYKSDIDNKMNNQKTTSASSKPSIITSATARRNRKWEIVMDPNEFDSLFDATWYYILGKAWEDCADWFKILMLLVGAHTLVVGGACYFYMSTLIENERAGIMPEILTPPVTPAMGPQQNPPPPAAPEPAVDQNQNQHEQNILQENEPAVVEQLQKHEAEMKQELTPEDFQPKEGKKKPE